MKFNGSFEELKRSTGIKNDPGGILEGLHVEEENTKVKKFEKDYPGISQEFDHLISILPDPDSSKKTEFPFSAGVVRWVNGKMQVLSRATNMVNAANDSTQHAEMVAIQQAQSATGDKHLHGCVLLSTAQPCEMCSGAIRNVEMGSIVYGISQNEMKEKHVKFSEGFKEIRTTPTGLGTDEALMVQGIKVFAGYKKDEVLKKLDRVTGGTKDLYEDPDVRL